MMLQPRSLRERMLDAHGRKGRFCELVDPYKFGGAGGAADPDFASVALLLLGDVLNTVIGTNYIVDSSVNARTVQATNAGTFVSTSDKMFGAGSLQASSGVVGGFSFTTTAAGATAVNLRTNSFTVDFWLKVTAASLASASAFSTIFQMGSPRNFYFARAPLGSPPYTQFYAQVPGGPTGDLFTTHCTAFTPDVWHFMSWTRDASAGFSYFHCDGTLFDTIADANDYSDPAATLTIMPNLGASEEFKIDDLRITLLARYGGSNYSVPTAAAPDH